MSDILTNGVKFTSDLLLKNRGFKCHYCGNTNSIKYKSKILIGDEVQEIYVCNKCALSSIIGEKYK